MSKRMDDKKIEILALSIPARLFTTPEMPSGGDIVRAVNAHDALLTAANKVLAGLDARIKAASDNGMSVPVYDGIADLHNAIHLAESEPLREKPKDGEK